MPRKEKPTAPCGVAPARQQGKTKSAFKRVRFCFSGRFSNAGLSQARPALPYPSRAFWRAIIEAAVWKDTRA